MKLYLIIFYLFLGLNTSGCSIQSEKKLPTITTHQNKEQSPKQTNKTVTTPINLAVHISTILGEKLPVPKDPWNKTGSVMVCPKDLKLFGDWLFLPTYNSGRLCRFKRDPKTAVIKYVDSWVMPYTNHVKTTIFFKTLALGTSYMYAIYNKKYFHWYEVSKHTGELVEKGKFRLENSSRGGIAVFSPDKKYLYIIAKKISWYSFDKKGTPSLQGSTPFPGGGVSTVFSPKGDHLYVGCLKHSAGVNGRVVVFDRDQNSGSLKQSSEFTLSSYNELKRKSYPNLGISPKGKHLYISRWSWDSGDIHIMKINSKNGSLTKISSGAPHSKMKQSSLFAFSKNGRYGYYVAGAEGAGRCTGWFLRDDETGKLTYKGSYRATSGRYNMLVFDTDKNQLFSATWSHQNTGSSISSFKTPSFKLEPSLKNSKKHEGSQHLK